MLLNRLQIFLDYAFLCEVKQISYVEMKQVW